MIINFISSLFANQFDKNMARNAKKRDKERKIIPKQILGPTCKSQDLEKEKKNQLTE